MPARYARLRPPATRSMCGPESARRDALRAERNRSACPRILPGRWIRVTDCRGNDLGVVAGSGTRQAAQQCVGLDWPVELRTHAARARRGLCACAAHTRLARFPSDITWAVSYTHLTLP